MSYSAFLSLVWFVVFLALGAGACLLFWLYGRDGSFFKVRWTMIGNGFIDCPCCGGDEGHQLNNPTETIDQLREKNGGKHYFAANWVDCSICGSRGKVMTGDNFSYAGVKRGQCVTRR